VGGGMENEWYSNVADSTFRNNKAESAGGGLYNDDQISVTGSTFRKNAAGSGGGIYQIPAGADNYGQSTPAITLTSSKISGNNAAANGGGIDNTTDTSYSGPGPGPGTVTVTSSTVVANSAGEDGGGIYNFGGGSVPLTSTAVTGNQPDNCAPANAVPDCLDSSATAMPAHELKPGRRFSPQTGVHCVAGRPGRLIGSGLTQRERHRAREPRLSTAVRRSQRTDGSRQSGHPDQVDLARSRSRGILADGRSCR
jgi:hypothetical protein